jgi:hypothetical protein
LLRWISFNFAWSSTISSGSKFAYSLLFVSLFEFGFAISSGLTDDLFVLPIICLGDGLILTYDTYFNGDCVSFYKYY